MARNTNAVSVLLHKKGREGNERLFLILSVLQQSSTLTREIQSLVDSLVNSPVIKKEGIAAKA